MMKKLREQIENTTIFCKKYGVEGKWKCGPEGIKLIYYYKGKKIEEEFTTKFTEKRMPFLMDTAVMMMEVRIEETLLHKIGKDQKVIWNG